MFNCHKGRLGASPNIFLTLVPSGLTTWYCAAGFDEEFEAILAQADVCQVVQTYLRDSRLVTMTFGKMPTRCEGV